jgi:hypothetical protein
MVSAKMQRQAAAAHLARMRAQLTAGTFVAAKVRADGLFVYSMQHHHLAPSC